MLNVKFARALSEAYFFLMLSTIKMEAEAIIEAAPAATEVDREALLSRSLDDIISSRGGSKPDGARRKTGGVMRGRENTEKSATSRGPFAPPKQKGFNTAIASASQDRRVYVGNIPWETDSNQLVEFFRQNNFPQVKAIELATFTKPDGTVRSKGYAVAAFNDHRTASSAIAALNDSDFMGRKIHLRLDKEESVVAPPRGQQQQHAGPGKPYFAPGPAYGAPMYGAPMFTTPVYTAPAAQYGGRPVMVQPAASRITVEKADPAAAHAHCHSVAVGNIPADITKDELVSIFAEVGPAVHAGLRTHRGANSTGWLHFGSRGEAARAVKEFNSAKVNDVPITVAFDTFKPAAAAAAPQGRR